MKKMFFTAVALMAFSATSMANTVEVKEVKPVEKKKVEVRNSINTKIQIAKKSKLLKTDCRVIRLLAYAQAQKDGFSNEEASGMSYSIYFSCLGW